MESYIRTALFWLRLWQDNGCPELGLIGDIRRTTHKYYYKARRMVIHNEEIITSKKLAESLQTGVTAREFWRAVRRHGIKKKNMPDDVD